MMSYKYNEEAIYFDQNFDQPLTDDIIEIMKKVKMIKFGNRFNQNIDRIPDNIKYIIFGHS